MADSQIQDVKDRIDIVDLINQYVPLRRAGVNAKGLCPFHKERSPSFTVNPERQSFKCFGCSEGGDVITFLQKIEGLTFPEALQLLADRAGIVLKKQTMADQKEKDEKSRIYRLNAAVASFFHSELVAPQGGEAARQYLARRKVTPSTIETFLIGYAPQSSGLVPILAKQGFGPADLEKAGHPERFRSRIMFPIRDPLGYVIGFTGRLIDDAQLGPKYLNTPETPIFRKGKVLYGLFEGKEAIRHYQVVILMEGQMDVILSHQVGAKIAIASSGTALTSDHLQVIRRYAPKVLVAFDADAAGQTATEKALRLAADAEIATKVVVMPQGMKDAGETIEHDPALWKVAIGQAVPGIEWLVQNMVAKFGIADGNSKKLVARGVLPHVRSIIDPVERAHAISLLAHTLSVPEQAIIDTLGRLSGSTSTSNQPGGNPQPKKPTTRPVIERLLGLLILHPEFLDRLQPLASSIPANTLSERLFKVITICYTPKELQPTANFLASIQTQLQREDQAELASLLMETEQWLTVELNTEAVGRELLKRLEQGDREDVKRSMATRIAQAEASGDRAHVKELIAELQHVLKPSSNAKT